MTKKQAVTTYYLIQSLAGGVWWQLTLTSAEVRDAFWSDSIPGQVIESFAFADIPLYVGGSLLCSLLVALGAKNAKVACWLVAGAAAYAGLFCIGQYFLTGEAVAAAIAMGFSVIGSLWAAVNAP